MKGMKNKRYSSIEEFNGLVDQQENLYNAMTKTIERASRSEEKEFNEYDDTLYWIDSSRIHAMNKSKLNCSMQNQKSPSHTMHNIKDNQRAVSRLSSAIPTTGIHLAPSTNEIEVAMSCLTELLAVVGCVTDRSTLTKSMALEYAAENSLTKDTAAVPLTNSDSISKQNANPTKSTIPSRRSIFDLSLYKPNAANFPFHNKDDGNLTANTLQRASSEECFNAHSKPSKSLLKQDGTIPKRSSSTVSFSNLEIREYTISISDHPQCSVGPPIQLGWHYHSTTTLSVDKYEQTRLPRQKGNQLILPSPVRRDLLLQCGGYTKQDLQWAWEEVERVKRERQISDATFRSSNLKLKQ